MNSFCRCVWLWLLKWSRLHITITLLIRFFFFCHMKSYFHPQIIKLTRSTTKGGSTFNKQDELDEIVVLYTAHPISSYVSSMNNLFTSSLTFLHVTSILIWNFVEDDLRKRAMGILADESEKILDKNWSKTPRLEKNKKH